METNQAAQPTDLIQSLEELAAYVNDRKLGYEKATENAMNPDHQNVYRQLAGQRTTFLNELNGMIHGHGGQTEKGRMIEDELYRQWVDTQENLVGGDDETIVQGNVKGEEWTLQAYERTLANQELSAAERQTLENQKREIQAAQTQLQEMRLSA